jgi:poly(3-hydroxybutyrate) depolymerase
MLGIPSSPWWLAIASLAATATAPVTAAASPAITQRVTPDHPMGYWVARPTGWKPGERYPVLVAIPDAEKLWEQTAQDFVNARDAARARFVVVVPLVVTNGGANVSRMRAAYPYGDETWARVAREGRCAFDLSGLDAVVRDVAARDGGDPRVFMAGIEAAGHTIFAVAFRHPERLAAAAVVSGNWAGRCFTQEEIGPFSESSERASLPIRTYEVQGDPQLILDQQARALTTGREHGFAQASLAAQRLASRKAAPSAIVEWFGSLLK